MKKNTRRMKFETLENRNLMAGNVLVECNLLTGFDARITGDSKGNSVEIYEISEGTYRVTGLKSNGSMTTVNGKAWVDVRTVNDDLWINMNGGDDVVYLGNSTGKMTVEDLGIDMGTGADKLVMGNIEVYEKNQPCNIVLGNEGDNRIDQIAIFNATFKGGVNISTGAGGDLVALTNVSVSKTLKIDTGSGTDKSELVKCAADEIYALLGSGNNDEITVSQTRAKKLTADGGSGAGDLLRLDSKSSFNSITKSRIATRNI